KSKMVDDESFHIDVDEDSKSSIDLERAPRMASRAKKPVRYLEDSDEDLF
ncbi:hypothetical protein scyTo_0026061, partial [Scyliorhinus torazame]|nr:hypothetical protein [Scyliorhinus torazame]